MVYNRNFSLDGRRDCAPDPKIYGMTRKNPYAAGKIVRFAREYDTGEAPQGRASLSEQEVKQALQFAIRIVRHCRIVITNEHPFHFYATSIHVRERPSIWEKMFVKELCCAEFRSSQQRRHLNNYWCVHANKYRLTKRTGRQIKMRYQTQTSKA